MNQERECEEIKALTENDSVDVPNPEFTLAGEVISVLLDKNNDCESKYNVEHSITDEEECLGKVEHVPLVNPNTGHSIVWTEASQKPVNPCWEIAEDKDVEETKGGE